MSGHRNFKELVAKMSPESCARVKAKTGESYISDWLRNRSTLEFIGIQERMRILSEVDNKKYLK